MKPAYRLLHRDHAKQAWVVLTPNPADEAEALARFNIAREGLIGGFRSGEYAIAKDGLPITRTWAGAVRRAKAC